MPRSLWIVLFLNAAVWAQDQPAAPTDPHALLSAAAKYYDFSSADLKPWHLKATYQLYDLNGKPTEEGTWEYWWASPKVHRSTWTRAGADRTEWQTADGTLYRKDSGEPLKHFERTMVLNLTSPFSAGQLLDPAKTKLNMKMLPAGSGKLACVSAALQWMVDGKPQAPPSAKPIYYCFDPATLALRIIDSNMVVTDFNRIVKTQGRYLAEDVSVSIGKLKAYSVSVEKIEGMGPADAALTPDAGAVQANEPVIQPSADAPPDQVTPGSLAKKTVPVYPALAKAARIQGTVILAATIGKDGKIRDLEVLGSPDPLLTKSALESVKQWEYKPYLLNGAPVEVETVVNVYFTISY